MKISDFFEEALKIEMPERLKSFFDSGEYRQYDKKYVYAIPDKIASHKCRVLFIKEKLIALHTYSCDGYYDEKAASYCPLFTLKEGSFYFAADISKPELPVLFFDYETGFKLHSATFESFLSKLLNKIADKTPLEITEDEYDKLINRSDYPQIIEDTKKLIKKIGSIEPIVANEKEEYDILLSWCYDLLADSYLETGDYKGAIKNAEKAIKLGFTQAYITLLDIYRAELRDYDQLEKLCEKIHHPVFFLDDEGDEDEESWNYSRLCLALAYLMKGKIEKSYDLYLELKAMNLSNLHKEMIVEDLQEAIEDNTPTSKEAQRILDGFLKVN